MRRIAASISGRTKASFRRPSLPNQPFHLLPTARADLDNKRCGTPEAIFDCVGKPMTLSTWIRQIRLMENASSGSLVDAIPYGRGCGRKLAEVKDPGIEPALERLLSDQIAGDPCPPCGSRSAGSKGRNSQYFPRGTGTLPPETGSLETASAATLIQSG
jgi:hypothetical protein